MLLPAKLLCDSGQLCLVSFVPKQGLEKKVLYYLQGEQLATFSCDSGMMFVKHCARFWSPGLSFAATEKLEAQTSAQRAVQLGKTVHYNNIHDMSLFFCSYISWDDYFMAVAMLSAKRSKDPWRQVR